MFSDSLSTTEKNKTNHVNILVEYFLIWLYKSYIDCSLTKDENRVPFIMIPPSNNLEILVSGFRNHKVVNLSDKRKHKNTTKKQERYVLFEGQSESIPIFCSDNVLDISKAIQDLCRDFVHEQSSLSSGHE